MRMVRWMAGIGIGGLCAAAVLVAPALQAQENGRERAAKRPVSMRAGIGTFTPAAADPKLAAILARTGLPESGFRFTPSEARRGEARGVTLAVRARSNRAVETADRGGMATAPSVSLAPIAYNLGVSVGWKRLAVSGDIARIESPIEPISRERANVGVSYTGKRVTGRVQAATDRPLADTPVLIGDKPNYSIDVGGSYSVTRNLAVTAGVRYQSETERLPQVTEDRRESRAVYVGTAFRF